MNKFKNLLYILNKTGCEVAFFWERWEIELDKINRSRSHCMSNVSPYGESQNHRRAYVFIVSENPLTSAPQGWQGSYNNMRSHKHVVKKLWRAILILFWASGINPAFSEILTVSGEIYPSKNSIFVGFDYSNTLTILSNEDHILKVLARPSEIPNNSGSYVLRERINTNTEISAVFDQQSASGCSTAFVTISARPYYVEFGVLLDPNLFEDERPIFAMQGTFDCSEVLQRDTSIVYRVTSTEVQRDDSWAELIINVRRRSAEFHLTGDGL